MLMNHIATVVSIFVIYTLRNIFIIDLAAGGSDDFTYNQGVPIVYTIELRDSGRYGFVLPENQARLYSIFNVLFFLTKDRATSLTDIPTMCGNGSIHGRSSKSCNKLY